MQFYSPNARTLGNLLHDFRYDASVAKLRHMNEFIAWRDSETVESAVLRIKSHALANVPLREYDPSSPSALPPFRDQIKDLFEPHLRTGTCALGLANIAAEDPATHTPQYVLRALVDNLGSQSERFCHETSEVERKMRLKRKNKNLELGVQQLKKVLRLGLTPSRGGFTRMFFVVRGMAHSRYAKELVEILEGLVEYGQGKIRVFVTGDVEIEWPGRNVFELPVEKADLEVFAKEVLELAEIPEVTAEKKEEFGRSLALLVSAAPSCYWLSVQIPYHFRVFSKDPHMVGGLRTVEEVLSDTLESLYSPELDGHQHLPFLEKALLWCYGARRPLKVWQLFENINMTTGIKLDTETMRKMLDRLAVFVNIFPDDTIRLSDPCVRCFLATQNRLLQLRDDRVLNTQLALDCLSVLSPKRPYAMNPPSLGSGKSMISDNFQDYASLYWTEYAASPGACSDPQVIDKAMLYVRACFEGSEAKPASMVHFAAEKGLSGMLDRLLSEDSTTIDALSCSATPLQLAAANGHQSAVEVLVRYGAKILLDGKLSSRKHVQRPGDSLAAACSRGRIQILKYLISQLPGGLDPKSDHAKYMLQCAAHNTELETVHYLLDLGVEIDQWSRNTRAVIEAVRSGDPEIFAAFLAHGHDIHGAGPGHNGSSLYAATGMDDLDFALFLLRSGVDPNYKAADGVLNGGFPIPHAAACARVDILEAMMQYGAKLNGSEALLWAVLKRRLEMVEWLIEQGADVNEGGSDGSPLEYAVNMGEGKIALALLKGGAEWKGIRPGRKCQMVQLVKEAGADETLVKRLEQE